jgi:hypothetical protein
VKKTKEEKGEEFSNLPIKTVTEAFESAGFKRCFEGSRDYVSPLPKDNADRVLVFDFPGNLQVSDDVMNGINIKVFYTNVWLEGKGKHFAPKISIEPQYREIENGLARCQIPISGISPIKYDDSLFAKGGVPVVRKKKKLASKAIIELEREIRIVKSYYDEVKDNYVRFKRLMIDREIAGRIFSDLCSFSLTKICNIQSGKSIKKGRVLKIKESSTSYYLDAIFGKKAKVSMLHFAEKITAYFLIPYVGVEGAKVMSPKVGIYYENAERRSLMEYYVAAQDLHGRFRIVTEFFRLASQEVLKVSKSNTSSAKAKTNTRKRKTKKKIDFDDI